jgi:protein-S-isoprenylcysteine O-methyltransferase Ste14
VLRDRQKYHAVLESGPLNILFVFIYNALCYLAVGIPSDPDAVPMPSFFDKNLVTNWYVIMGQILIVGGVLLLICVVRKRKVFGGQDTGGRLFTKGIYRFSRHPIYVGIVLISLGIAIARTNFDGMAVFPLVFLANYVQATLEEKYDVGVRFKEEYQQYRKQTAMFGPWWFWLIIVLLLGIPVGMVILV